MSKLLEKMKKDLALQGYSPRIQKTYLQNVNQFSNHFDKPPKLLFVFVRLRVIRINILYFVILIY